MKIPKSLLVGIGALLLTVTAFVGVSQATGVGHADLQVEPHIETISLRFRDEPDGGVGAYHTTLETRLFKFNAGEGGFVRTALRALTQHRQKMGIGPVPPFELMRSENGNVVLSDPSTGKQITLDAFGDSNQGDFAQLFDADAGEG
jgi:putative photosynthetic complex assembly protein